MKTIKSVNMKEILGEAVIECKLPYHLQDVTALWERYNTASDDFTKLERFITDKILNPFIGYNRLEMYKKIHDLKESILSIIDSLPLIESSVVHSYIDAWAYEKTIKECITAIDEECEKIELSMRDCERYSSENEEDVVQIRCLFPEKINIPTELMYPFTPYLIDWENEIDPTFVELTQVEIITQLRFIKIIFSSYNRIIELYQEIFECMPRWYL